MYNPRDQRARARIRLGIQARIRQIAPPRNLVEIATTEDVSRNGILFATRHPYEQDSTVWVTMPYNAQSISADPEFPGSVVRIIEQPGGIAQIAVQFHSAHADTYRRSYDGDPAPLSRTARQRRTRVTMTLPIRVRRGSNSEESVTVNISRSGVLFRTNKHYSAGENVMVCVPYQPGAEFSEVPAQVVRMVERAGVRGVALHFTVHANQWPGDSWEPTSTCAA